jgi:hypothetical protein
VGAVDKRLTIGLLANAQAHGLEMADLGRVLTLTLADVVNFFVG